MKECKYCNKEFEATSRQKYCSKKCKKKNEWRTFKAAREAEGKIFKTHGGNHTGKTGKEHYAYKDGNGLFKRVYAKEYYLKVRYCERCSNDLLKVNQHSYAVHHKDHDRRNNEESNFELLCKRCHQVEHKCWEAFI